MEIGKLLESLITLLVVLVVLARLMPGRRKTSAPPGAGGPSRRPRPGEPGFGEAPAEAGGLESLFHEALQATPPAPSAGTRERRPRGKGDSAEPSPPSPASRALATTESEPEEAADPQAGVERLREYILWREILGPPRALAEWE